MGTGVTCPNTASGTALYDKISANEDKNMTYTTEVSYMEIYNEQVNDLLPRDLLSVGKSKTPLREGLRVREHKVVGPYVEGLTKLAVESYEAIETLMTEGNKVRRTAATAMNDRSSRSHAVFTLIFTQAMYDPATKQTGEKVSRLCLVDLAGSERSGKTGAKGARLREGSNINTSLTTLGRVISALAERSKQGKSSMNNFVPYRDSKLTWLLKDNLGGNAKTVMMAALSPASDNYDETMSTLRYADHAKQIVNAAVVNEDPNQRLIRELKEELERLRSSVGGGGGGGGGTQSAEETEALRLQLLETEGMIADMTQSWEEKLEQSNSVIEQHKKLLASYGAELSAEQGGLHLKSALPHFVSISNELDYDITIYSLKEGFTWIGTGEADVDQGVHSVVINGEGIDEAHCQVEHRPDLDNTCNPPRLVEVVEIHPISELVYVNGKQIMETTRLKQGMVVQLGKSLFFRFNHPTEAKRMKELRAAGLLPEGIAEEDARIKAEEERLAALAAERPRSSGSPRRRPSRSRKPRPPRLRWRRPGNGWRTRPPTPPPGWPRPRRPRTRQWPRPKLRRPRPNRSRQRRWRGWKPMPSARKKSSDSTTKRPRPPTRRGPGSLQMSTRQSWKR